MQEQLKHCLTLVGGRDKTLPGDHGDKGAQCGQQMQTGTQAAHTAQSGHWHHIFVILPAFNDFEMFCTVNHVSTIC